MAEYRITSNNSATVYSHSPGRHMDITLEALASLAEADRPIIITIELVDDKGKRERTVT